MTNSQLPKATLPDIESRDAALIKECCDPLETSECLKPEAGAVLSTGPSGRLPLIVDDEESTCEHCGEPIYEMVEVGRRKKYCRTTINAIKLESLKPTHLEAEARLYYHIRYIWGSDGFISGAIKHSMTLDALAVYLAQDKVMKDADGNITLLALDA